MGRARTITLLCSLLLLAAGCRESPLVIDRPRLTPSVRLVDTTFHSHALNSRMHLRFIFPAHPSGGSMPVVYLLHGAGVDYRDWTNNSDVASFAANNVLLVLPDAIGSYYIDEATGHHRDYEQYLIHEVREQVHEIAPASATDPDHTAIVGISRGGYGALTLGLKHPELFGFIGDISGSIDFPERSFRWSEPFESHTIRRAFGAPGSETRQANDPFLLVRRLEHSHPPYIFISCGDQDLLQTPNRRFADDLQMLNLPFEFHTIHGKHDWNTWNTQLPMLEAALLKYFGDGRWA